MELVLAHQTKTLITVTCDGRPSHTFDLRTLVLKDEKKVINDPVGYGKKLYEALLPPGTPAQRVLAALLDSPPGYLLLITTDNDLDAVPWEYAYGPDGFLVQEYQFVRGLPVEQRIAPPVLNSGLHVVAVPSNPLSHHVEPLNIDGEWMRLKEIIQEAPYAITLERSRPPTIEQVGDLLANHRHRVVHFMGHGGQDERGAVLFFEKNNGDLNTITAEEFLPCVRESTFLITLNACMSATPGPTLFSNLAAALARQKIPYALGMRFSISDRDARVFSRVFYSDLARGSSVEEALLQARLTLANSPHAWVVGVPVLYTALARPAAGFTAIPGIPSIIEHQPCIELSALPYTEGILHGRIQELKWLGNMLTGSSRPPLVTIHGPGGQGKTTLAREVAERFAHAWPGGVWATSLENLPSRELFVNHLARFLGIIALEEVDSHLRERQVLARLAERQTLIVLDNAETLVDAVEAGDEAALHLAQFIREQLSRPPVSLLATSRSYLGWGSEIGLELRGLAPQEGAMLFQEHASRRRNELKPTMVWNLSEKVEGHPLSLCLLGSAFNSTALSFSEFVGEYDRYLLAAENKYKDVTHRHRTIYASIEASVDYLSEDLYALFSCLWVFHAPFVPEVAAAIVAPETKGKDRDYQDSPVLDQLYTLWQRGLLTATVRDNIVWLYHLLPTIRHYIEKYVKQTQRSDILLTRFGEAYAKLAPYYVEELNNSPILADAFQQSRRDFERAEAYVPEIARGDYSLCLGRIMQRLGDSRRGLLLTEQALEIAQGRDHRLERRASYFLAAIYQMMGQPNQALALFERTKLMALEAGDRQIEASALSNLISLYHTSGYSQRALKLAEQALPVFRELHARQGEAMTLNHMAAIYQDIGQLQQALALFKQALLIQRELGDRDGETLTLNNIANALRIMGHPQQALVLFQDVLSRQRALGFRLGEAIALHNMAMIFKYMGRLQQALRLAEQAALIRHEVGDSAGEALTLNLIAEIYRQTEQPQQALTLYEQTLRIQHEIGDRFSEAATLNNTAEVYRQIRQPQQALIFYEQALVIARATGNRAGEAATLNNMALLHQETGQLEQALSLYENALLIRREIDDRVGEASTLNGMGYTLRKMHRYREALTAFEQSVDIERQVNYHAGEVAGLVGMALVLYENLQQPQDAIAILEQAIAIMIEMSIDQDAAGNQVEELQQTLEIMREGETLGMNIDAPIMQAVYDFLNADDWEATHLVVEERQSLLFRPEVEALLATNIAFAQSQGDQPTAEYLEQHLALLRACKVNGINAAFEQFTTSE